MSGSAEPRADSAAGPLAFAHCGVSVSDVDRALAFYEEGLGLHCVSRRMVEDRYVLEIVQVPGTSALEVAMLALPNGQIVLELLRYAGCDSHRWSGRSCDPGTGHVCLFVNDVHSARERALAAGGRARSRAPVRIESGPYEGGAGCYLSDPDGYTVELVQHPPALAGGSDTQLTNGVKAMDGRGESQAPVAIVTGGASGLGLATAQHLHRDGYRVVVADVDEAGAGTAANALQSDGAAALGLGADVTDRASVDQMVDAALERFGRLDVLINNAGYAAPGPTHELDDESWSRMLDVHLDGTMRCSRAAFPALVRSDAPAIVNIASIAAYVGMPMRASYTAAKAGIEGLTRVLAVEWGTAGIRVNAVAPGFIHTPLMDNLTSTGKNPVEAMLARVPLGRLAEPEEIAAMIAFVASPVASYLTGQVIVVDGGMTIDGRLPGIDQTVRTTMPAALAR